MILAELQLPHESQMWHLCWVTERWTPAWHLVYKLTQSTPIIKSESRLHFTHLSRANWNCQDLSTTLLLHIAIHVSGDSNWIQTINLNWYQQWILHLLNAVSQKKPRRDLVLYAHGRWVQRRSSVHRFHLSQRQHMKDSIPQLFAQIKPLWTVAMRVTSALRHLPSLWKWTESSWTRRLFIWWRLGIKKTLIIHIHLKRLSGTLQRKETSQLPKSESGWPTSVSVPTTPSPSMARSIPSDSNVFRRSMHHHQDQTGDVTIRTAVQRQRKPTQVLSTQPCCFLNMHRPFLMWQWILYFHQSSDCHTCHWWVRKC